ncbi:MAG: DEAD/DEAH box helicase [Bacteriovoracia bacterium]
MSLLIAPPAWGKTRLLLEIVNKYKKLIIFISPLRALSQELEHSLHEAQISVINPLSVKEMQKRQEEINKLKDGFVILTYELAQFFAFEKICKLQNVVTVFDEFHLLSLWGSSFRPLMWEIFYKVADIKLPMLALSATIDKKMEKMIYEEFTLGLEHIYIINLGNNCLLYPPSQKFWFPKICKRWWRKKLWKRIKKLQQRTILVFCAYREEVKREFVYWQGQGINVLSCIGGETVQFQKQLKENPNPQLIIATSALGHGVNLPLLDSVFITYVEEHKELWLQMVGRGGRKKEKYDLYTFNSFELTKVESFRGKIEWLWGRLLEHWLP